MPQNLILRYRAWAIGAGVSADVAIPTEAVRMLDLVLVIARNIGVYGIWTRVGEEAFERMIGGVRAMAWTRFLASGGSLEFPGYRQDGLRV